MPPLLLFPVAASELLGHFSDVSRLLLLSDSPFPLLLFLSLSPLPFYMENFYRITKSYFWPLSSHDPLSLPTIFPLFCHFWKTFLFPSLDSMSQWTPLHSPPASLGNHLSVPSASRECSQLTGARVHPLPAFYKSSPIAVSSHTSPHLFLLDFISSSPARLFHPSPLAKAGGAHTLTGTVRCS